jgi:sec-independent protein translocase protein TatC
MHSLADELEHLKWRVVRYGLVFVAVTGGLLVFSSGSCQLWGRSFLCPTLGGPSLATELFLAAQTFLVPPGVAVVALGPVSVFFAPLSFALLVAFLATFPYGLFQAAGFLLPALRPTERRVIVATALPALILFYLGAALAFFFVIPKTFALLYSFAPSLGVAPLFALDDFLGSSVLLTLAAGLAFLLPVAMALLSRAGLVPRSFWIVHWRGALLLVLVFSAMITPDGSGVTMAFLALPLMGLYGAGIAAARPPRG